MKGRSFNGNYNRRQIVDTFTFLNPYFVTVLPFCPRRLSFQPPFPQTMLCGKCCDLEVQTSNIGYEITDAPDHKAIYLSVEINDAFHCGPGTWNFNNQLLEDGNYVQLITECLPRISAKHPEVESHQIIWELIKMEFRAETITYSKAKRREVKRGKLIFRKNSMPLIMKYVMDMTILTNQC